MSSVREKFLESSPVGLAFSHGFNTLGFPLLGAHHGFIIYYLPAISHLNISHHLTFLMAFSQAIRYHRIPMYPPERSICVVKVFSESNALNTVSFLGSFNRGNRS